MVISSEHVVYLDEMKPLTDRTEDVLVDLFCGMGGSGGGLLDACDRLNRKVHGHFVNHWDKAIEIHTANHPEHKHYREDLFVLDPETVLPANTFVSLLWCSPSCTFFSLARGAACVNEQDRSHAHSVTDWISHLRPEGVILENVKEWLGWGPTMQKRNAAGELMWAWKAKPVAALPKGHTRKRNESEEKWGVRMLEAGYVRYEIPDPARKGEFFRAWLEEVKALGYDADWRILRSADYGDPTIRQRLFLQLCRKDCGKRIVWPNPTHAKPDKEGAIPYGLKPWRTAREIIDWSLKGSSVFSRKKPLARNTFRRLAIGLVKHGLKEFLLPSNKGWQEANVRGLDEPLGTLTTKSRAEGLVAPEAFLIPNFGERPTQQPRVHSLEDPLPTVTSHGAGGLVQSEAFLVPKDQGWQGDYVRDLDSPVGTVQTTSVDHLALPSIIQLKGQSTAQSIDEPLTAVTGQPSHYVMTPLVDHIRGTGVAASVDEPLRSVTAGARHEALAEAFMMSIDQTGGGRNHGTYSVDEPVRTLVTKANSTCVEFELVALEDNFRKVCDANGFSAERAETFLEFLVAELHKVGKLDAKPWIYVYYSNGSEGADIDTPLPTVRCKAGTAVCYPVIEFDGRMLRIDLFYRMLTPKELQRAMGFPDSMEWSHATQTEKIKAIGNSVSHGVARALGLAWYSQQEDVALHLD
jgi:DNA (cytosine-5)-methyltransferase 1